MNKNKQRCHECGRYIVIDETVEDEEYRMMELLEEGISESEMRFEEDWNKDVIK